MIEPDIAALACANATAGQLAQLKVLCDEVEMLYTQGHDHIQKDVEFHSYIAKISGNMVVERLIPVINTSVVVFANNLQTADERDNRDPQGYCELYRKA